MARLISVKMSSHELSAWLDEQDQDWTVRLLATSVALIAKEKIVALVVNTTENIYLVTEKE